MEKNVNAVGKPVQLPEGHMCSDCCADCAYIGAKDSSTGKYKCGKGNRGGYVYGGDPACSEFKKA